MIVFTCQRGQLKICIFGWPPERKRRLVMVRAAITADGRSPLVFIDSGVKINAEYFGHRPWIFQQDSAPSHSARITTEEWLKSEVPRFISTAQWKPTSSDPLDYCAWGILESKVGTKK